ncbi:MAG: MFS transporter [Candidatus Thorarchaeota archaeon]
MSHENLPLKSKLAYGGFWAGVSLPSQIFFSAITFFYNTVLGLRPETIGIAWLFFSIWNTINDPIFGFLIERTKSEKYGRRIPYIRFGAPIYGAFFILCWIPIVDVNNQVALFFNLIFVLFVFDTLFTILGLINYTLPAEMVITAKARANLMVYGNIINSIALFISFVLPTLLLIGNSAPYEIYLIAMIFVGIVSAIILFISSFYLKENMYTQMEETLPILNGIKETFKNEPFLIFEVSIFSFTLAQTILTTAIFYYVEYVLLLSGLLTTIPLIIVFIMIFAFLMIFNRLVGRYGVKKTFILTLLLTGLSFLLIFFIGWDFISALIGFILIGIGFSGYMITNNIVMADIVDYDEILTGKRRETSYSGMNALITKPAISIGNWLFLLIISFSGFNSEQSTQTFSAQLGILAGFSLIPSIFLIISAFVMFLYPLDGPQWQTEKNNIIEIHRKKENEYQKMLERK